MAGKNDVTKEQEIWFGFLVEDFLENFQGILSGFAKKIPGIQKKHFELSATQIHNHSSKR